MGFMIFSKDSVVSVCSCCHTTLIDSYSLYQTFVVGAKAMHC